MTDNREGGSRGRYSAEANIQERDTFSDELKKRRKKRKRKRALSSFIKLLLLFVLLFFGWRVFKNSISEKYSASSERKDLNEWFEVENDRVRVYLNDQLEKELIGIYREGEVYLPYNYLLENINDEFFFSTDDNMLSYSLPDKTFDWTLSSKEDGHPAFIEEKGEIYASVSLFEKYSDISVRSYADGEDAKRIFIDKSGRIVKKCHIRKDSFLRTRGGIKSPVLTEIPADDSVILLESMDTWCKVRTSDGFIGYTEYDNLADYDEYTYPSTFTQPLPKYNLLSEKVVLGWNSIGTMSGNNYIGNLIKHTENRINVVCPTWIQISDADGNYENLSSEEYVTKAHQAGIYVWAAVDNFSLPGGLKDFNTGKYFSKAENRRGFIERLLQEAEKYDYDGINLDFEGLSRESGPAYVQFYKELSIACHEKGLVLSIDDYVPYHYYDFYKIEEQGIFADYVILMSYDEHTASTEAGSVASLPFTQYGLAECLKKVSPEKLIMTVPVFTRVWTVTEESTSCESMGMTDAAAYIKDNKIETEWDEAAGQYYGEKEKNGAVTKIWLEDEESLKLKVNEAAAADIGGIGVWRLGYEPSSVWEILDLNAAGDNE